MIAKREAVARKRTPLARATVGVRRRVERDDRVGGPSLAVHEGGREDAGHGDEAEDLGRAPGEAVSTPDAREHQAAGRPGQETGAGGVERIGRPVDVVGRQPGAESGERDEAEGDVDVEDPPPARLVDEDPSDQGPGDRGDGEGRRDVPLVAAALPRADEVAHGGHRERHQAAGRRALGRPRDDQGGDVLGDAADHRRDEEHAEDDLQQTLATVSVAELAPQRSRRGRGDDVGAHHPRDVGQAAEVGGDRRQRGRQHRLVEHGREHREDDRRERDAHPAHGRLLWIR